MNLARIVTLAEVRRSARDAIEQRGREAPRVIAFLESVADPALRLERAGRILGPHPRWADYVLGLGEPGGPELLSRARAEQVCGSAAGMRRLALRLLEVAEMIAPLESQGGAP